MAEGQPARLPYAYAPLRLVPRVERGECLNVGVVLFCRSARFLAVAVATDEARWAAVWPALDLDGVRRHLETLRAIAAGDVAGGAIARLPHHERFGWLTAPTSTIVQPGPVHGGACADPAAELDHLFGVLVLPPDAAIDADARGDRWPPDADPASGG